MMCGTAHKSQKNSYIIIILHKGTSFIRWLTDCAINACNYYSLRAMHVAGHRIACEVIMNMPIEQSPTLSVAESSQSA